jgi:hypothetical protein
MRAYRQLEPHRLQIERELSQHAAARPGLGRADEKAENAGSGKRCKHTNERPRAHEIGARDMSIDVLVGGVDKHKTRHLITVSSNELPHVEPTERMADQDHGPRDIGSIEQAMEFCGDNTPRAAAWIRFAGAVSGSVIGD